MVLENVMREGGEESPQEMMKGGERLEDLEDLKKGKKEKEVKVEKVAKGKQTRRKEEMVMVILVGREEEKVVRETEVVVMEEVRGERSQRFWRTWERGRRRRLN
ncbi:hypothetical protein CEUSTIGMA_g5214.t1 [Chlamydomonas eustigma]|uniref:Uncharacterized protein n=1 Tax=Chlamydomonas eustigma TaxID=1157962 RepID=A0A250X3Y1_9CHLO|nr:hypothetical protein CEUSTIGMA_g5214.t1 [Chlamydomonas eustigma]|eukprot:GAX77771.1 hypothetical protein CEUSTIGMA_g5214.t1 [Chlamydomonas eustigma]